MNGYKHILVPLDGSECSERALVEAQRIQQAFGSKLTMLYVVSDPDFDCAMGNPAATSASVQRDCAEAEKYLAYSYGEDFMQLPAPQNRKAMHPVVKLEFKT